jgi:hypothetical protein
MFGPDDDETTEETTYSPGLLDAILNVGAEMVESVLFLGSLPTSEPEPEPDDEEEG